jgi:hypothetical protein
LNFQKPEGVSKEEVEKLRPKYPFVVSKVIKINKIANAVPHIDIQVSHTFHYEGKEVVITSDIVREATDFTWNKKNTEIGYQPKLVDFRIF